MYSSSFILPLCLLLNSVVSSLVPLGTTIELGSIPYYVPGRAFGLIPATSCNELLSGHPQSAWVPVTVVKAVSANANAADIEAAVTIFSQSDDVWTAEFLSGLRFTQKFYTTRR